VSAFFSGNADKPARLFQLAKRRSFCLALALWAILAVWPGIAFGSPDVPSAAAPKNVILLIGDGMGFAQVQAAGLYANGTPGSLFLESLPHRARVVTASASTLADPQKSVPTDSAAAATAMATGVKVHNGVLSVAIPGDGRPLETVLEHFASQGKMTGLVSTAYITDATPAAFGAHSAGRGNDKDIIDGYLRTVRPNILMGGGDSSFGSGLTPRAIRDAGYELVTDRAGLAALRATAGARVFGLFGSGNLPYEEPLAQPDAVQSTRPLPTLSEMASASLRIVAAEPRGFFLMIEGGLIDKAAHTGGLKHCLGETIAFDRTVRLEAIPW